MTFLVLPETEGVPMAQPGEIAAMRRALDAARMACTRPFPNPFVGCVLLDSGGNELALGVHRGAGTAHAEADALNRAGDRARGATAIVTLEPCNHSGRTGPCSKALIAAGVARVVYAQSDPNPIATGGAATLLAAGIDVEGGVLATESEAMNAIWTHSIMRGRPFVTWKYAATIDGRVAAPDGTSQWITGAEARRDVQALRAEADAIMVGTGTVLADNPRLTLRGEDDVPLPYGVQPLRVVVGETRLPDDLNIWNEDAPTIQIRSQSPSDVLKALDGEEIRHVWLEGGPRLSGAFLDSGLVDRVIGYITPAVLGAGIAAAEGSAKTLNDLSRFAFTDVHRIGQDIRVMAQPSTTERSV